MPEPTSGDLERWLLRRGITLSEYERMPWVRRDFLYSEFRREWSEDPWTLIEKVLHNINVLRRQLLFSVETKGSKRTYKFCLRFLDGIHCYISKGKDVSDASNNLARELDMRPVELVSIMEGSAEIWNPTEKKWIKARPWWEEDKEPYSWEIVEGKKEAFPETKGSPSPEIPIEVKESISRFWEHFLRARGLLVPPIDVPRARVELQGALSEIGYQKGYMNPQDYEKIKAHLELAIDFLNRDLVPRAIAELEELFSFLVERMAR